MKNERYFVCPTSMIHCKPLSFIYGIDDSGNTTGVVKCPVSKKTKRKGSLAKWS